MWSETRKGCNLKKKKKKKKNRDVMQRIILQNLLTLISTFFVNTWDEKIDKFQLPHLSTKSEATMA